MLMHNNSGKWLRWSERQARGELAKKTLVIHTFKKPNMMCVWWS